ncbi:ABC transporter substrate-binding protein [Micromonospora sp. CPCC 205371]|nr:ABC transporter substrate-binding protein [Micromonospora sp. CPCC 205371]
MWVAKEKGYFAEAGIDVQILSGAGTTENLALLAAGKAQFAACDLSAVMVMLGAGDLRQDVRAVAAIQQRTLNSITTVSSTGIAAPRDLSGRTIGGVAGGAPWLLFPAYAKLADVDARSVTWLPSPAANLPKLLAAGKVDGIGQFVVARSSVEKVAGGRSVVVLPYSDVLSDLYGNALITSTKTLDGDPELVRRFSTALLAGLAYAVDHPEEAGQILHKHVPAQDPVIAADELRLMRPYVRLDGRIGTFDPGRVARAVAILRSTGVVKGALEPADVVSFEAVPAAGGVR